MTAQQNLSFAIEQILRPIVVNAVEHVLDEIKAATPSPAPVAEPDRFITKKEVATLFGVSEVSVWDWEKKGLLTGYRIGNLVRYKLSEVMASPKMIIRLNQKGLKQ
ncbi:hypothetical protein GVN20_25770 [Runella sp. CRIBMP]|uniref:helix-turn-helix transcriptional regulator n=1 Tax=Runella sp. CRIBMP TaxID=2683261 RepID=UPI00141313BF|nr:helix-turn-helix domain-containing protein [Runella sp. CRIBMP]NBB22790.1 hypothetical protein [Runella sp. CRIBMP]